MSIKKVIYNILSKGPGETYLIYKTRAGSPAIRKFERRIREEQDAANKPVQVYSARYMASRIMSEELRALGDDEGAQKAEAVSREIAMTGARDFDALERLNDDLKELETDDYKKHIKSKFIKEIIPEAYDRYRDDEIENKILFLQPRWGLNQSCKLLFRRLEKLGKSEVRLYELNRWKASLTEEYVNLLDFVKNMATARAVVTHEFNEYFGYVRIRPETKMIQLWHGCGIIKGLGMDTSEKDGTEFKSEDDYKEYPEFEGYDLVTIPSEEERGIFESMMGRPSGCPEIKAYGVSRTDVFFDRDYLKTAMDTFRSILPEARGKKVILYAPTFRGLDPDRKAPEALDILKMKEELSDEYVLVLKYHQTVMELPEVPEEAKNFAFDFTRGKGMDINELLSVADILITDYSSVVFEYSLFEKPVLFFQFDRDEYEVSRNMYYSKDEMSTWGKVCGTTRELIDSIRELEKGYDKGRIKAFKDRYMNACDGHSTDRIIDFIYKDNQVSKHGC